MISFICSSVVRVSLAVQDCRILVFTVSRTALYSCCNLSNFWCISLRSTANTDLCLSASAAAASAFPLDSISCSNLSKVLLCSARSCSVLSSRVSDNLFFSVWKLVICCWKREQTNAQLLIFPIKILRTYQKNWNKRPHTNAENDLYLILIHSLFKFAFCRLELVFCVGLCLKKKHKQNIKCKK